MIQINKYWIIIKLIAVFILSISFNSGNAQSLSEIFHTPPDSVKPSGYWWWLNGNVDKEAITRDLEEFKAKGLGAVLLVSSGNFPNPSEFEGNAFLGDVWMEYYKHALR